MRLPREVISKLFGRLTDAHRMSHAIGRLKFTSDKVKLFNHNIFQFQRKACIIVKVNYI